MNTIVIIPARMASTRLPGKPLADIAGRPMIVRVMENSEAARIGPVYVACAEAKIADEIKRHNGKAILTDPNLPSGSDRVKAAVDNIDPEKNYDVVINVQGDMPTLDPSLLRSVLSLLKENEDCDIATAVVRTSSEREKNDPNVVKAVLSQSGQALYFSRSAIPNGDGPIWHHIGIYAYRREALAKFCELPPSLLELRERLEQLRALEAGMKIYAAIVDVAPEGVDTPEDLERARKTLGAASV